jgi:hypothetical protein
MANQSTPSADAALLRDFLERHGYCEEQAAPTLLPMLAGDKRDAELMRELRLGACQVSEETKSSADACYCSTPHCLYAPKPCRPTEHDRPSSADKRTEKLVAAMAADSAFANGEGVGNVPNCYVEQARDELNAAGGIDAFLADPNNFVWRSVAR